MKFGTGDLQTILFSICEFRENRHREGRAFVMGVMKLHSRVHRETVWRSDNKERLGKAYVLRHGVHRLLLC